jgi:hypothetical protein
LKEFEEAPEQAFDFSQLDKTQRKKRRIVLFWIFSLLILSGSIIFGIRSKQHDKIQGQLSENTNHLESKNKQTPNSSTNKTNIYSERTSTKEALLQHKMVSASRGFIKHQNSDDAVNDEAYSSDIESEKNLLLKTLRQLDITIPSETNTIVSKKPKLYRPGLKPFPFQIHFQVGLQNETGVETSIESSNQHKDAEDLFKRSTGKHRSGSSYSLAIERRLGLRWQISTGIIYSSNTSRSTFDYYYTDLPVYDTTGQLQGYFTRPRTALNYISTEVSNSSQTLAIPVSVNYRLLYFKRMSFWTGATAQLALKREIEGQYFNFKTEQLQTLKNTFNKGLIPGVLLGCRYPISSTWMFSTQIQVRWQRLNYTINEIAFKREEVLPSFNIGFVYTPYYKIK